MTFPKLNRRPAYCSRLYGMWFNYLESSRFNIVFVHCRDGNESPLEKSGCFNYFTVGWITGIMLKAFRSGLGYSDLFRLPTLDQSKESAARLQRLWEEEQGGFRGFHLHWDASHSFVQRMWQTSSNPYLMVIKVYQLTYLYLILWWYYYLFTIISYLTMLVAVEPSTVQLLVVARPT